MLLYVDVEAVTVKIKLFFFSCLHVAECEKLMEIYERLEELDADKAEVRASRILFGLGFTPAMQHKKLKDFSGGWRMRVSLARYARSAWSICVL